MKHSQLPLENATSFRHRATGAAKTTDQDLSHVVDDEGEAYDYKFMKWMIKEKKLAAIPVTAFVGDESKKQFEKYIRLCFIKQDSTLDAAENILKNWTKI